MRNFINSGVERAQSSRPYDGMTDDPAKETIK